MTPENYKDNFFSHHLNDSLASAEVVIPLVINLLKPKSVIDIGCGIGTWLHVWEKNGVDDLIGVDGEYVNQNELLINKDKFIANDLENGFKINRKFDLVTCLEVAEHVNSSSSERLISSLCDLGDFILFSAAIPGQEGTLHVNEQYPDYWLNLFKTRKYVPIDCIRNEIWSDSRVSVWYRQNILLYVKEDKLSEIEMLRVEAAETNENFLNLVHPGYFDYKTDKANQLEKELIGYKQLLENPTKLAKYIAKNYISKIKNRLSK